jgi:drug/metabolite transporter (DMT)-like permease
VGVLILITKGSLQSLLHIRFTTGDLLMLIASFLRELYHFSSAKTKGLPPKVFLFSILGSSFFSFRFIFGNTSPISALFLTLLHFLLPHVGVFASLVSYYLWNEAITLIGTQKTALIY